MEQSIKYKTQCIVFDGVRYDFSTMSAEQIETLLKENPNLKEYFE